MAKKISTDAGDKRLVDDDDYEYEKSLAQQRAAAEKAEQEAYLRAEEERKKREHEAERAREKRIAQEKLELLQLKNGVIDEEQADIKEEHEETRKLKGFERVANIWYHDKLWIIFGVFIIAVIAYITYSEVTRKRPDLTVMMIANNGLATRQEELQEFFEKYTDDIDGNGYVYVQVIDIPLDPESSDYQTQDANNAKWIANIQSAKNIIVITDSNTDEDFKGIMKSDLSEDFPDNPYIDELGLSLNMKIIADELKYEYMPNDVHISLRTPIKTISDSLEDMQENYDISFKVFKNIVDDVTTRAIEENDPGLETEPVKRDTSSDERSEESVSQKAEESTAG